MVAASAFATLVVATLVIVDPDSTLKPFASGSIVAFTVAFAFVFNVVVIFVVGGFLPPPDSEAIVEELTKEEATEETGVEFSSGQEK